jgi:hypothetical protein
MYHHRPLLIWSKGGRQPSRVDFRESIPQRGQFRHAPADMFLELPPFLSLPLTNSGPANLMDSRRPSISRISFFFRSVIRLLRFDRPGQWPAQHGV